MSTREHSLRTDSSVNTSGSLKEVLQGHAYERCRHFFLYVFTAKALTDYVNQKHGLGLGPTDILYVNATHQVDTGLRSTDTEYYGFDAKDKSIVDKSATSCGRMDAAHFCNLGIEARCYSKLAGLTADKTVESLLGALIIYCGDTRQLPQRVNIGPDKIIDKFHGDLATIILGSGKPPITKTWLRVYLEGAEKVMNEYSDKQAINGNDGIVACVKAYCACYTGDGDSLWQMIGGNARAECEAYGLKLDDYFAWL
jgi:hypothetical protein